MTTTKKESAKRKTKTIERKTVVDGDIKVEAGRKEFICSNAKIVPTARDSEGNYAHGHKGVLYIVQWQDERGVVDSIDAVIHEDSYRPRRGDTIVLTGEMDGDSPIFTVKRYA